MAILPYIDQKELYEKYRLNEPWDSDHNKKLIEEMPAIYGAENPKGYTTCFVLVGPETPFDKPKGKKVQEFIDGTSNTLLVVEAKREIPWTKPADISYDPKKPLPELGGFSKEGFLAAYADGSVRRIPSKRVTENQLRAAITYAGSEIEPIEF